VNLSTLTIVSGLVANTTYYLRVGGINWNGVVNYVDLGSTVTTAGSAPAAPVLITAVYVSSITATWNDVPNTTGYDVEASSTNFNGTGIVYSTVTIDTTATTLTVGTAVALASDTTYYVRVGALYNGATSYAVTTPISTSTLTSPIIGAQLFRVNT